MCWLAGERIQRVKESQNDIFGTFMAKQAELEIAFGRGEAGAYECVLRFKAANSDAFERESDRVKLDIDGLKTKTNSEEYGKELSAALFKSDVVRRAFTRAQAAAQGARAALRIRLLINKETPELHSVRWELLRDAAGKELLNGSKCWFSRYLGSENWPEVSIRPKAGLQALVMIASPSELPRDGMQPLAVEREQAWAEKSLAGIELTRLISNRSAEPETRPTMENLVNRLRDGVDILFLICHGQLKETAEGMVPRLWLENSEGKADVVAAGALVEAIERLPAAPRLIVLASCQSAGTGASEDALAALGPKLAAAGVPAVIAMQGKVAEETIDAFLPTFFVELQRDGQLDRAMAVARGEAYSKKRRDYWMPVLFLRLESGRLWEEDKDQPTGLFWLLLPTAVILTLVVASMFWRVPARVNVDAMVNQVKLHTIEGDAQVVLAQAEAESLGLSGFQEVRIHPEKVWAANPAKYDSKSGEYPGDAWQKVMNLPPGNELLLTALPAEDQLIRILPWLEPGSATDSVRIGPVSVKGNTTVTLSTPERGHSLSIRLPGSSERSSFQLPKRFRLRVQGAEARPPLPYRGDIDLRVELAGEAGVLSYTPAKSGTTIVPAFAKGRNLKLLDRAGIPVDRLEFFRETRNTRGTESSLAGAGEIRFDRHSESVKLAAKDILEVNQLGNFRLAGAELVDKDQTSTLRLELRGTAGGVSSGPPGGKEDRRLSLFDLAIHDRKLVALFVVLLSWLAPTLLAGRNYLNKRPGRA